MPLRRRLVVFVAAMATLGLVSAGCTKHGMELPGDGRKVLRVAATLEPPTLDPTAQDAAAISQFALYNVYETLIKVDGEGEVRPLLAQTWNVSRDGLRYTFTIHPSAHFASGRPVTADDVVWSVQRVQEKGSPTQKEDLKVVDTVARMGERTVQFTLKRPSNNWLYVMTSRAGVVFDSKASIDWAKSSAGSGPYNVESWKQGAEVRLAKNANYWGTPARFDAVDFVYIPDAEAMNKALVAGDVDVISNVQAPASLEQFSDADEFTINEGTTNAEVILGFNHKNPALAKTQVRQAINYAIDRSALLRTVWNNKGTLIGSMVPPTDPWYENLSEMYAYDPAKAKQLLAEAGVKNLKLRLRLPNTAYATGAAKEIARQLQDVGIRVVSDQLEFPRWYDEVFTKGDYDLTIASHVESHDIYEFTDPNYYWHYNNPAFNNAITAADRAAPNEYAPQMRKAAKMLADDAAACWLFLMPNLVVSRAEVNGIHKNATTLSFDLSGVSSRR